MVKKSRPVAKRVAKALRVSPSKNYRILVDVGPHETPRNLGAYHVDHCCMPQPDPDGSGIRRLHAYSTGATVLGLRKSGRKVEVLADADAEGKRLQKFIGKGDRFKGGCHGPPGVGKLI
jgi:hypothetical protein